MKAVTMGDLQMEASMAGFNIAIIGMAGRFPGARNVHEFWDNLRAGVESISVFSEQELRDAGIAEKVINDRRYVKAGAMVDDADKFDAAFFEINPKEAELLDPQHRLFLECAWEALEDAGYDTEKYRGEVGVYGGVSFHPYLWSNLWARAADPLDAHLLKINLGGSLTARVSYKLNLRGPSITVQSGCSTSLVTVHLACQSLLGYECDMALAGGVSVDAETKGYFCQEGALSPDGHTRAFDAKAQGVVGGNGVALVVLKRLVDAVIDGDHIYAVIKGSAINNDGSFKIGYTAPSVQGQARAILAAQMVAGVPAETITYIETHGTGTPLGDTLELRALSEAFRASTGKKQFCAVGSVKTNVGHLDNAAGVTGLIKTALALHHKMLPPSLNFESPNPEFDFAASPFFINTRTREWKNGNSPRRAGVSSFGIGGTNAHAILEESPQAKAGSSTRSWQLLTMTAKTASALELVTSQLTNYLKQHPESNLADVAYTCQLGRRAFNHRRMVVCVDSAQVVNALETLAPQRVFTRLREETSRPLIFMFPGCGAQYLQVGRGLYREEKVFREQVDLCAEILQPELGFDLRRVLYPDGDAELVTASSHFTEAACAMSVVFTVEYALAGLYMSWGLFPEAMIGHSLGEYVAASLAGVLSLADTLRMIVARGNLFEQLDEGAMLSVPLPEDEIEPLLSEQLSLAAVNGPSRCVVSGPPAAIAAMETLLTAKRVNTSRLQVNRAGHSEMVAPILTAFSQLISKFKLQAPTIPFISNVTGTWITAAQATDPDYWVSHLRRTVRYGDGIRELVREPARILLEVGPGQTLSSLARRQLADKRAQLTLPSLREPLDKQTDMAFLLGTLGKLWLAGVHIKWDEFYREEKRQRLSLPTYPFERKRYWRAPKAPDVHATALDPGQSVPNEIADWFYTNSWKRSAVPKEKHSQRSAIHQPIFLVFMDELGLGDLLVKRLEGTGRTVVVIKAGEAFRRVGEREYAINPQIADDYQALLLELKARHELPGKIIYLWSLGPSQDDSNESELLEDSAKAGYFHLLSLAADVEAQQSSAPLEISLILSNTQEVTGEESLRPGAAMMQAWFTARVEQRSTTSCRSVDIQVPEPGMGWDERVIEQVFAEIIAGASEPLAVYRGPYRWVPTYERIDKETVTAEGSSLRDGGVYLVINGLEGAGLGLAEYLAKNVRAKLVLTTPSEKSQNSSAPDANSAATGVRMDDAPGSEPLDRDGRLQIDLAQEAERINGWEEEIDQALSIQPLNSFPGLEAAYNSLCTNYSYSFLQSGGLDLNRGVTVSHEELARALQIPARFKPFLELLLADLSKDDVVRLGEGGIEFLKGPSEMGDPQELRQKLSSRYPGFASSFWLLDHCVKSYPAVFSGKASANSVLYPDGSYEMLQRLATSSIETSKAAIYRHLVARIIADLAARTDRKLRILEVGGGTGILTELILNALAGLDFDYHFTDLGRSFVLDAKKKWSLNGAADLRCGVLDISTDPEAQGYGKESYDVILAFDVVQATKDVSKSLGHLRSLLAPDGAIFLLQTLKAFRWQHLTFGLSPGWWNFKDDPLRGSSPVLSLGEWDAVLRRHDFATVQTYPQITGTDQDPEFGLVVAQRSSEKAGDKLFRMLDEREELSRRNASKLETLRSLGAEVLVAEVETADSEQLRKVIDQACLQFKEIHGVFYVARSNAPAAAAVRPIMDPSDHAPCLSQRLELHALESVLRDMSLDFCLLLSPLFSIPGTVPGVAEAAMRGFMEAFVYQRNRTAAHANWVCSSWERRPVAEDEVGEFPATREETELVFQHLLAIKGISHVFVFPAGPHADRAGAFRQGTMSAGHENGRRLPSPEIESNWPNVLVQRSETEDLLAGIWQELLGVTQVDRHDNFFDLGGDSLIALQLISRLRDTMQVDVAIADLFERQTLADLAEFISQRLSEPSARPELREPYPITRGDGDIDDLLTQLEQLSDAEVLAHLYEDTESSRLI